MNRRLLLRPLLASATIAAAIALAGCDTDGTPALNGRHMQPISERMLADLEQKNMSKDSAIMVRIFKEESELEVWKQDRNGYFALLKTFPICRWSGDLGPKIKEGDRQAPEGFYTITPGLMNPNSSYYLAINTGFPNAYDRSHGRTGGFLMIHGDCSSRGCYAMTDEQMAEIYALARESFFGGQKAFQIQAFPFRMTPANMARHRNSPHMAFWRMLKQGYDHFEVTRLEPKVDVCERRYVFNAESNGRFNAGGQCPAYRVPEEIASRVRDKQRRDDIQIAELSNRGSPTAASRAGVDGGMNKVFLAALRKKSDFVDADGRIAAFNPTPRAPGTIPAHVNPPRDVPPDTGSTGSIFSLASFASKPAPAPEPVQVASAGPTQSSGGFFGNLFSFGSSQAEPAAAPAAADPAKSKATAKPAHKPVARTATASVIPARKPQPESRPANVRSASAADVRTQPAPAQEANAAPQSGSLLNGAAPTMQSNAFDGRFGGWR